MKLASLWGWRDWTKHIKLLCIIHVCFYACDMRNEVIWPWGSVFILHMVPQALSGVNTPEHRLHYQPIVTLNHKKWGRGSVYKVEVHFCASKCLWYSLNLKKSFVLSWWVGGNPSAFRQSRDPSRNSQVLGCDIKALWWDVIRSLGVSQTTMMVLGDLRSVSSNALQTKLHWIQLGQPRARHAP